MHKRLVNELLLKFNQFRFLSAFLLVGFVILLSACNMPMNEVTATPENQIKRPSFTTSPVEEVKTAPTTNSVQPATPTPKPSKAPTRSEVEKLTEIPTDEPKTPILQNNSGSQLAYLAEGDIWLIDLDTDKS